MYLVVGKNKIPTKYDEVAWVSDDDVADDDSG